MADPRGTKLITSAEGLHDLATHLREVGRFGFDTEFVSEDTFEPSLCLIQVASTERIVVVDPLAVPDLGPFWDVVLDPEVEVIMHAMGEDMRICRFQTGRVPDRLFDVQLAAGLVGYGYPMGLARLAQQLLGANLASGESRTDWRKRPLSPEQIRYALDDVTYLIAMADRLKASLLDLGRSEWVEQECRAQLQEIGTRDEAERWRRLSGVAHLDPRGLETVRLICQWRLDEARRDNRPLRQVMRDDLIVAIAKRMPRNARQLEALRDFNRPHLTRRSREIVDLVQRALQTPEPMLPEPIDRPDDSMCPPMLVSLLNACLSYCSTQNQLASGLVGTTNDIKNLIRWHLEGRDEEHQPGLMQGWRGQIAGQPILDVLDGRLVLRVADIQNEVPITLERRGNNT